MISFFGPWWAELRGQSLPECPQLACIKFTDGKFGLESFSQWHDVSGCRILTLPVWESITDLLVCRWPTVAPNPTIDNLTLVVLYGNDLCLQIGLESCFARCNALFQKFQAPLDNINHWWRCLVTNLVTLFMVFSSYRRNFTQYGS